MCRRRRRDAPHHDYGCNASVNSRISSVNSTTRSSGEDILSSAVSPAIRFQEYRIQNTEYRIQNTRQVVVQLRHTIRNKEMSEGTQDAESE
tara:strand:+ start:2598 stop:2870 length:273 start_codon:yes stop_codon:yes gene_type:complete